MGSLGRLRHICKTIKECSPQSADPNASTLFMNYANVTDLKNLTLPNVSYYSPLKKQHVEAKKIGFETPNNISKKYETVIVSVPKTREEALGQIAIAYEATKLGGLIILEGNKRDGIDSIIKALSDVIKVENSIAKAHGKIVIIKVSSDSISPFSNQLKQLYPSKNRDGFFSVPGLFSYKKIDSASQFLTSAFDEKVTGDVIDLGAGWGFLSFKLLSSCSRITSVTLLDHDLRALDCAKLNIKSEKAKFLWSDINEVKSLGAKFDNAICNPPFHSNKGKDIKLGINFIKASHHILKNGGNLLLVANIQLPYENVISNLFYDFKVFSQNKYFKIIFAKKSKRA